MDELIAIVDHTGNYTGKTCLKSEAHTNGFFHLTVHIWLYTSNGKILLQKRAPSKKVFPNMWDISVAGHVAASEKIMTAALREVKEEIGLKITAKELFKITVRKHQISHSNGIQDNEFHHVFIAKLTCPFDSLTLQKEEVSELKLYPLETLKNTQKLNNILLPQYHDYYCFVYDKILEKINS
ncbi:NUDIX hydrolase [Tenacibaculum maritimum]|uniref:NUDIX hydrolase n=1 Tax=Tenacibaculum maritimum TaxID=107401 RepID=UPI0012E6433C|nr:NUDIX domain-containing protein [Tenacibaculum maritimum]CAA0241506.1 NUDIX hydrolase [Tenacibaculum maritimum]